MVVAYTWLSLTEMFVDVFVVRPGNKTTECHIHYRKNWFFETVTFEQFSTSNPFTLAKATLYSRIIFRLTNIKPVSVCPVAEQCSIKPPLQNSGNKPYSPLFLYQHGIIKIICRIINTPFSSKFCMITFFKTNPSPSLRTVIPLSSSPGFSIITLVGRTC
jgi:hypothetical protein